MTVQSAKSSTITAVLVPENERLNFLPKMFPGCFSAGETAVYFFTSKLCSAYNGARWNFYTLSNGGFYMAPALDGYLSVEWEGNAYEGVMKADTLGVTACLFALNYIADVSGDDNVIGNFYKLRDYISAHPESAKIFRAID